MYLIFPRINGPIDCYLTYDVHVTKTVSSFMNQLVQRGRIEHLLDKKTHLLLINSLVQNFALGTKFCCQSSIRFKEV